MRLTKQNSEHWTDDFGQKLIVHEETPECFDNGCVIHHPSYHPLSNAKRYWRSDRGLMERICEHGVGHPDPDDLAHKARIEGKNSALMDGIHGCDGCCSEKGLKA